MPTDNATKGGASRWLLGRLRSIKQQPWAAAGWRVLRRFSLMQSVANGLRERATMPGAFDPQKTVGPSLPPNQAFLAAKYAAHGIDGMFSDFSMAVVDSLLSLQKDAGVGGNLLEFGVYKGRSAALLGRHLAGSERLVLVDIIDYLERSAIAPFRKSVDLIITPTEKFRDTFSDYDNKRRSFRFVHIDASHDYRATFTELRMADELLGARGVVALDDFTNLNYSQNLAAIFKYLYTADTELTIFLVTDEKAYLCRKADFAFYAGFVLDRMIAQMASREITDCVLARTDVDPEYSAIYARGRLAGETGHHYGVDVETYRNNFQRP